MSADDDAHGFVAPGYEVVREVFAAHPSGGSALCVLRHGERMVDLREGWADAARTRPWVEETLVNVYSVGKPVIALAVLLLVDRGLVGLDDPIARHWPEFLTPASVRQVLTHTAGLPFFPVRREASDWGDWDLLCADLAGASPQWPPGTVAAEHALTYGHLLGEVVRRVDGRPPARFVAEEIAAPWGLDFGFGAAEPERCAELEFDRPDRPALMLGEPGSVRTRSVLNPPGARDLAVVNSPLWRNAVVPAVNLHATAPSLARFYAGLLAGGVLDDRRLLSEALVDDLTSAHFSGHDHFIESSTTWGLGVQLEPDGTWGMGGLGGNAAWADPATGHAIAFVTRQLGDFDRVEAIDAAIASVRPLN
ncbi:serine hydrolase domain-containing protein [Actinoplanes digitatis]|uniref:CubicO group peptidase (Beta-lactamase class C family) n=1 Tax=Actinoplanes digitatis TaxID=1868 RepID=A0A7W7I632_9ACTN|nr:serine hydrolase domain-containing protein [Actinoplanes digitatis]MBB4767098.1 CubicO group peptidase (beta-lactamase class C family) [Actinoplanes digitatis]